MKTTGSTIIGFPPGVVTGTDETATAAVLQARADALDAYNTAQGLAGGIDSTANSELGGQTLQAGIYKCEFPRSLFSCVRSCVSISAFETCILAHSVAIFPKEQR